MKFITLLKKKLGQVGNWVFGETKADGSCLIIEFPSEAIPAFAEIQQRVGADSPVEVLRKAVPIYDMLTDCLSEGGTVTLTDGKGETQELKMEDLFVKVPSSV